MQCVRAIAQIDVKLGNGSVSELVFQITTNTLAHKQTRNKKVENRTNESSKTLLIYAIFGRRRNGISWCSGINYLPLFTINLSHGLRLDRSRARIDAAETDEWIKKKSLARALSGKFIFDRRSAIGWSYLGWDCKPFFICVSTIDFFPSN